MHRPSAMFWVLLSVLAGHWRYADITALRCDPVNPPLLGMQKVVSEDAVRRALDKIKEQPGLAWLQEHLDYCTRPLLSEPWVLDIDTTVKPFYGHQEGAVVSYNLFVRLADPDHHREAVTSRPLLLQAIGRQTKHAGRTTVTITSTHGNHQRARRALTRIAAFFTDLRRTAEQLTVVERWYRILSHALVKYLRGRQLVPPKLLPAGAASYG